MSDNAAGLVAHHLRLVGLPAKSGGAAGEIYFSSSPVRVMLGDLCDLPPGVSLDFAGRPARLRALRSNGLPWGRLRTFHDACHFTGAGIEPLVVDEAGRTIWGWFQSDGAAVILVGTDLGGDLTLIRQGDPEAARQRPTEAQWGYAGERPNYLFDRLVEPGRPGERLADWWIWSLRDALCGLGGLAAAPVLPFAAPGAVVVTGDDDQADIASYAAQANRLGHLPITYFLHPLTKHTAGTLAQTPHRGHVEWELHPDALAEPDRYAECLHAQGAWFEHLTGRRARLVRNHGFLNDGYWGHLDAWLSEGITGSSNIPGVDGRVVNGSLLPARLVARDRLTDHWSLLTAFGDGVFFVYDWSDQDALERILAFGRAIVESNVPGLVVLNLHPANETRAHSMHEAAHHLVEKLGFAAWRLGDALDWFLARDQGLMQPAADFCIAPGTRTRIAEPPSAPVAEPPDRGALPYWSRAVRLCRAWMSGVRNRA